jgi:signal transduction histidine kinase
VGRGSDSEVSSSLVDGKGRRADSDPGFNSASPSELEVLQGISRAFGSSPDVAEASAAAVRWVRAAVGSKDARVRLFLRGSDDSLHPVLARPEPADDPERQASRREVLRSRRPSRVQLGSDQVLATLPLVSRSHSVGVIEVVGPSPVVEERWSTLEAVASQIAIAAWNIAERSELAVMVDGFRDMAALAGEMTRARSPEAALRAAARFFHQRSGRPVAGWISRGDASRLELLTSRGVGPTRTKLRQEMRIVTRRDLRSAGGPERLASRFAEITGQPGGDSLQLGGALLLLGFGEVDDAVRAAEPVLEDILTNLSAVAAAERRSQHLDGGIALTAHEIRGPLIGVLAIIERLLMTAQEDEQLLLRRSRAQLEQLSHLVDGLLRWAVGGEHLDLLSTDLVPLVREAVASCSEETGSDRVVIRSPSRMIVRAAPHHLRAAIANVVRNALLYSAPDSKVSVTVRAVDGDAVISVRDRGPGVPVTERDDIFDPFVRGSMRHLARSGNGLGLFIARRIMRAHHGEVWLGASGPKGTTFHLQVALNRGQ